MHRRHFLASAAAAAAGIACVTVGRNSDDLSWVDNDFASGTTTALAHLAATRGAKPALFLSETSSSYVRDELSAYLDWCSTAGIEPIIIRSPGPRVDEAEPVIQAALAAEQVRADDSRRMEERVRQLELQLSEARRRRESGNADQTAIRALESELAAARSRLSRTRSERAGSARAFKRTPSAKGGSIIDTSFTMDIGETVVVGTSRLHGNSQAIIALLTSVPARSTRLPDEVR